MAMTAAGGILTDLYLHQAWADSELWKALESYPAALDDAQILKRLHHIYEAQRAYLLIVQKAKLERNEFGKSHRPRELKELAKLNHGESARFLNNVTGEVLGETVSIPWFREAQRKITVEQALVQAVMHSQYHRGQNAVRLRELGGDPPPTDFILWLINGKPGAVW